MAHSVLCEFFISRLNYDYNIVKTASKRCIDFIHPFNNSSLCSYMATLADVVETFSIY